MVESVFQKPKKTIVFNEVVSWIFVILLIVCNIVLSIILIPFILVVKAAYLFPLIVIFGMIFGYLMSSALRDIEAIDRRHHIITGVFIPALALITMFYSSSFANFVIKVLKISTTSHNPIYLSVAYSASFILPYFIMAYKEYKRREKGRPVGFEPTR